MNRLRVKQNHGVVDLADGTLGASFGSSVASVLEQDRTYWCAIG